MELVELLEQTSILMTSAMDSTTLYLSVVSGYLIVAYTVGKKLSTFQLCIITALFLAFSVIFMVGTYLSIIGAHNINVAWGSENYMTRFQLIAYWLSGAEVVGIIAALAFMYDAQQGDANT